MCPSYRATGEELHSTRGRARLLFEMANGEVITGGWQSRRGGRGARPVPVVQGLQARLPGRAWTWRRTRPSSWPSATEGRLRPGSALLDGRPAALAAPGGQAPGGRGATRSTRRPGGPLARGGEAGWAASRRSAPSRRSPGAVHRPVLAARRSAAGLGGGGRRPPTGSRGRGCCCGPTRSPTTSTPRSPPTPSPCSRPSATPSSCRRATVCCGLTWTSTGQVDAARRGAAAQPARHRAVAHRRRARSSGWSPRARPPCAPTGTELLPDEPLAAAWPAACARSPSCSPSTPTSCARPSPPARVGGAGAGALPPARRARHRGRPCGHGRAGHRRRGARLRLLRPRRQLRLREGPLRGVDGLRGAGAAARGARRRPVGGARRRLLLPHPAAPGGHREPVHLAQLAARVLRASRAAV